MADAAFDAVIVGGGTKAMVTAIYLAKYGGMSVGVFERRHELGGGLSSHEAPAPGFIADTHASTLSGWYYYPIKEDFPDFAEKGGKFVKYTSGAAIIREEDHACWLVYNSEIDPAGERSAKELARFSGEKDAETYLKAVKLASSRGMREAVMQEVFNLPPPPGERTPVEKWMADYMKEKDCLIDHRWFTLSAYRSACELWDSKAVVYMAMKIMKGRGLSPLGGALAHISSLVGVRERCCAVGGTHSIMHAYQRILLENGGKFFTKSEVDKILIENGKATGVRLADGTQIGARKIVVTGIDPHQLCFQLIGKEHLSESVLRKVQNLARGLNSVTWYTWAVHELPQYKAASFNPDISRVHWVILGSNDCEYMLKELYWRMLGKEPPGAGIVIFGQHSLVDETRSPRGKHVVSSEEDTVSATAFTEREWMAFKKTHAEKMLRVWKEYAPNMSWDNVIGYDPNTPYDAAVNNKNMWPEGTWSIIDRIPGQAYPFLPIPEMAHHRTPVQSLYATGSAWGPVGGGDCSQGYTCYKAIAHDLGLKKPWEDKARPF